LSSRRWELFTALTYEFFFLTFTDLSAEGGTGPGHQANQSGFFLVEEKKTGKKKNQSADKTVGVASDSSSYILSICQSLCLKSPSRNLQIVRLLTYYLF
jgi:hypothetical protein